MVKLTHLNGAFSLKHVPILWEIAEIIMTPKPGELINEEISYSPISMFP